MTHTLMHARAAHGSLSPRHAAEPTQPEQPDLPQLDLPPVPPSAASTQRAPAARGGLPKAAFAGAAFAVAVALWGAWVTKEVLTPPAAVPMASVRLEMLIGEYVQAQARSNAPPEVVTGQTQAFMAALGQELKRRGQDGTTVLVGEAVLSSNVPDITPQVRAAIYARVPAPAASAAPPMQAVPPQAMPLQGAPMLPAPMPNQAPGQAPLGLPLGR